MKVAPTQIQARCPACGTPVTASVWPVIDVGQEPDLKRRLLRGQLNVAACPGCASRVAVATPLAYHDPDRELFLILVPSQMSMSGEEQDKTIGDLTNLVMNSLAPERRRGYLFQPKTFFSMESLLSEILRADGITEEMMQEQKQKAQLIQDLLAQLAEEAGFNRVVEDNKDSLDYEFFLFLSASIEQAREDGDQQMAEDLTDLRERLNAVLTPAQTPRPEALKDAFTREDLIERLFSHKDDQMLESLVAIARPVLDYQFFQALTGRIEAAQSEGQSEKAEQLTALRTRILDLVDQLDKAAREALDRASALLEQIINSDDPKSAVEEHVEQIDAALLTVLEANIIAAKQSDQPEKAEKLNTLKEHVVSLLEARLPPEMRLLNQLISEEGLEQRRRLLQEQAELISEDFLKLVNLIVEDLRSQDQGAAAERLAQIIPDAHAILQGGERASTDSQTP